MEPFATKIVEWLQLKVQSKLALPASMSEDSEEKKKERVSNSLDPDQAQNFVGPDLGPNCLQRLSADNKNRTQRTKSFTKQFVDILLSG